jgi:hypothetical protein
MTTSRQVRERGSVMIVALVILVALLGLGGYAAVSVKQSIAQVGHDRHEQAALYAAESGVAAGIEFLRRHYDELDNWSAFVTPNNEAPVSPPEVRGNGARPGEPGNLFDEDSAAWYEVSFFNHIGDPELALGNDSDGRILVHSVGHGPNGTSVSLEVEVRADGSVSLGGRPCPAYAQRGIAEDGAGRNDCLGAVIGEVATFEPGT